MKTAFLFPGQGSQEVGMGADLFQSDAEFGRLVQWASECAGADLRKICLRGPDRELVRTEYLQPLLVAVSLGYYRKLIECGIEPDIVLGHSLGEITALAAAGVLTPEEAVEAAARRGRFMATAASKAAGGMLAVITSQRQQVIDGLSDLLRNGRVFLANDNTPDQLVLSGPVAGLEEAARLIATARLGLAKRLPVSGPWHSPLMSEAQREFAAWLRTLSFRAPRVPLLMNVSASMESEPDQIRLLVERNLTEPVQWRSCMANLAALRPEVLFEIGPGRVLSGLARANGFGEDVRILNINHRRGLALAVLWRAGQSSNPEDPKEGTLIDANPR